MSDTDGPMTAAEWVVALRAERDEIGPAEFRKLMYAEWPTPSNPFACACGWSGDAGDMRANASGIRVCPRCGASGGLVGRRPR